MYLKITAAGLWPDSLSQIWDSATFILLGHGNHPVILNAVPYASETLVLNGISFNQRFCCKVMAGRFKIRPAAGVKKWAIFGFPFFLSLSFLYGCSFSQADAVRPAPTATKRSHNFNRHLQRPDVSGGRGAMFAQVVAAKQTSLAIKCPQEPPRNDNRSSGASCW